MSKIAVIYWSGTGNTEAMAKAVAQGARGKGASAELLTPDAVKPSALAAYTAVALGCPAMGAETLEEDEFAPMFAEIKPDLAGKKVALFGSYGWGGGEWMQTWSRTAPPPTSPSRARASSAAKRRRTRPSRPAKPSARRSYNR